MEATTNDLRSRTKDLLDLVIKGGEIIITYHGKPCAKLVPYAEALSHSPEEGLFGIWSENLVSTGC